MSDSETGEAQRFTDLWERHAVRVLAYARRHVDHFRAQEVVAETFLVAWRRLDVIPGEGLPWLLVVARNTIRSGNRSQYRDRLLATEVARLTELTDERSAVDAIVAERDLLLRALATLTSKQREALLLINWDGLTTEHAAHVAGCSIAAFKVRLHRARQRLRRAVDTDAEMPRQTALQDLFPGARTEETTT